MSTTSDAQPFSVLLRYPDIISDDGDGTYFAHVMAAGADGAASAAKAEASAANEIEDPDDFRTLLVIAGHHADLPTADRY